MQNSESLIIDESAFERLAFLDPSGTGEFVSQLIDMYLTTSDKTLVQLDEAFKAGNLDGAAKLAHSLKSSSANLGVIKVAAHCAQIEKKEFDGQSVGASFDLLVEEYEEARECLLKRQHKAAAQAS